MIKKIRLPLAMSGLVPIFILAHFSHHIVGGILGALLPFIREDLHLSYAQLGIIMSAFNLVGGLSQLPAGYLADRLGQRIMIIIGISGVAVTAVLIGISNTYLFLIISLVLAALLGGGYHASAVAVISNTVPDQQRGRSLGFHAIGGTTSMFIVPLIAAPIAASLTWHAAYLILAAPAFLLGLLVYFLLGRRSFTRPVTAGSIPSAAPTRFNWGKVFPVLFMVIGSSLMAMSVTSYLSLYAVDHLGIPETAAGMLVALTPAVGFLASPLGGYFSDRFGSAPVLILMSVLLIPLLYIMGIVSSIVPILAVLVVIGLVSNVCMPVSESFIMGNSPVKRRSTIMGTYYFVSIGLGSLIIPFMGNLIDRFGFQYAYTLAAIVVAAVIIFAFAFMGITGQLKTAIGRR